MEDGLLTELTDHGNSLEAAGTAWPHVLRQQVAGGAFRAQAQCGERHATSSTPRVWCVIHGDGNTTTSCQTETGLHQLVGKNHGGTQAAATEGLVDQTRNFFLLQRGEGLFMADVAEVQRAYDNKEVELQTRLTVRIEEFEKGEDGEWVKTIKRYETTAGRALLSEILPKGMPFTALNRALKKKEISRLINQSF